MTKKQLKNKLAELLRRQRELEKRLRAIREKSDAIIKEIALISAKHTVAIGTMKDEKGKPLYPTQEIRRAALTVALAEDEEHQALKAKLQELLSGVDILEEQLHDLESERELRLLEAGLIPPGYGVPWP